MTVEPQAADSRPGPRLLLVEDDAADALLFEELLAQTGSDFELAHVTDLSDAISAVELLGPAACVLDLGLPGCQDLEALEHLQSRFETLPIVVLTGRSDEAVGARAVSMGAQDYLLKGHESGASVLRSIRYAIERRVAEQHAAALQLERARAEEQVRMESALLGQAETVANGCRWSSRYVAARDGVVGGDFIDCVELGNDRVRMVVGDVAGHGPDEAALGVALRVAWRTLALVVPAELDLLPPLEVLLLSERRDGADFATVLDVVVDLRSETATVRSAGHPPPVIDGTILASDQSARPPLGVGGPVAPRDGSVYALSGDWSITIYTDGLYELRRPDGDMGTIDDIPGIFSATASTSVDELLDVARRTSGSSWRDDVAIGQLKAHR
jgi:CheY-like chemotaxis protein